MQHRRRRIGIVGAGAVLAVVLAGCGEASTSATGSPELTRSSQPDSATETSEPSGTSSTSAPSSTRSSTPSNGGDSGNSQQCTATDIKVTLGKGGGAAGSYYAPLRFTNTSSSPCVIGGYPGVSYVAGDDAHQVGPPAERVKQQWQPVKLAPGEVAHATVRFVQVHNYPEAACQPTKVTGVRVYLPGEKNSTVVPYTRTGCSSDAFDGEQLTVKPVVPGPGGR